VFEKKVVRRIPKLHSEVFHNSYSSPNIGSSKGKIVPVLNQVPHHKVVFCA